MLDRARRNFLKLMGITAVAAGVNVPVAKATESQSKPGTPSSKPIPGHDLPHTDAELIPGVREQAKGLKCYVESDYAPLKACIVGNPSAIYLPNPDTWEYANVLAKAPDEMKDYMRKHAGRDLKESDPEMYEKMAKASDNLADAYRKNGVRVMRNESGNTPQELIDYTLAWSRQKQMTLFGQSAGETFGNVFVCMHEVSNSYAMEITHREAIVEIMKNDPEAVFVSMPALAPTPDYPQPGPFLSPGDPLIFDKRVVIGIGVSDPSHIKDPMKPRSSGNEFGAEMLRRLLQPFGWSVEVVYFDMKYTYHIDCLWGVLEEGLMAMPKGAMFSPMPDFLKDWEILEVPMEDHKMGFSNNEPLGNKRLVMPAKCPTMVKTLEKRGWDCIEVDYESIYSTIGSGIHCSTASIWRES